MWRCRAPRAAACGGEVDPRAPRRPGAGPADEDLNRARRRVLRRTPPSHQAIVSRSLFARCARATIPSARSTRSEPRGLRDEERARPGGNLRRASGSLNRPTYSRRTSSTTGQVGQRWRWILNQAAIEATKKVAVRAHDHDNVAGDRRPELRVVCPLQEAVHEELMATASGAGASIAR